MKKIDKTRKTENVSAVAEDSNNDEVYTLRAQVYEQNNQVIMTTIKRFTYRFNACTCISDDRLLNYKNNFRKRRRKI